MPENSFSGPETRKLDDASASAYRYAVLQGRFAREEVAVKLGLDPGQVAAVEHRLASLHLLRPMPGEPDTLVPISPDAAAADLVAPVENMIRMSQLSVDAVRAEILSLMPAYFESRRRRNQAEAFDTIPDIETLQAMLDDYGARCRTEILTAQPGGSRPPGSLEQALPLALDRLQRGLVVRHLYQHTVRKDLATSAYVRTITKAGAEVRTTDQIIDRMVIYDRSVVFVPEQHVTGRPAGAAVIREPSLVAFLGKVYDHMWQAAIPFAPDSDDAAPVTDELRLSIIKLMAEGHKDEVVARRLGMSVRTCRRHISEIMEEADSASRFQAGFRIAMSSVPHRNGVGAEGA